jgi:hypothetical protein
MSEDNAAKKSLTLVIQNKDQLVGLLILDMLAKGDVEHKIHVHLRMKSRNFRATVMNKLDEFAWNSLLYSILSRRMM